ncbi:hypothetical protein K503DRAFT_402384 [Rhizopogon vinicolor AM-OR11-026]|uniref:Uncharacterized protein n=1 Tax=Rhizopogon vinicolor AM-OR11-026 TaxID=1314800 RepID=A0A1B7NBE7_9AGAM|nr:hypothetical protein K503DRAFT_402384 [Rhizopogon vinicolor AM-OR11-026]
MTRERSSARWIFTLVDPAHLTRRENSRASGLRQGDKRLVPHFPSMVLRSPLARARRRAMRKASRKLACMIFASSYLSCYLLLEFLIPREAVLDAVVLLLSSSYTKLRIGCILIHWWFYSGVTM